MSNRFHKTFRLLVNETVPEVRFYRPDGEVLTPIRPQATAGGRGESAGKIEGQNFCGMPDLYFIARRRLDPSAIDAARFERGQ
ncbi:MAG: hypothetical protein MUF81_06000 [Verrucomicrobia bacterium]|jgi:hypothetical protein|nr:hypothetical protein [Verrucomicrobiota bacterium]